MRPTAALVCPHWLAQRWHTGQTLPPAVVPAAVVIAIPIMTQACGQLVSGWWPSHVVPLQQASAFSSRFLCENAAISVKPNIGQKGEVAEDQIWSLPNVSQGGKCLPEL